MRSHAIVFSALVASLLSAVGCGQVLGDFEEISTCVAELESCDGVCTYTRVDPRNCGACGRACPSNAPCEDGLCACPTGQTACGDGCVSTPTDVAHCGACDHACPQDASCDGGACACPAGQTICGDACVDTQTDDAHCGACGTACKAPLSCLAGTCGCSPEEGLTECTAGACSNLSTDPQRCGGCDIVCPNVQVCSAGACVCRPGFQVCDVGCIDPLASSKFCGQPGVACDMLMGCGPGGVCSGGKCGPDCSAGLTNCAKGCVDLGSAPLNCGACDVQCKSNEMCVSGQCKSYVVPILGCESCPCAQCPSGTTCCTKGLISGAYCLDGDTCPG
jgi:hypothetical protein